MARTAMCGGLGPGCVLLAALLVALVPAPCAGLEAAPPGGGGRPADAGAAPMSPPFADGDFCWALLLVAAISIIVVAYYFWAGRRTATHARRRAAGGGRARVSRF